MSQFQTVPTDMGILLCSAPNNDSEFSSKLLLDGDAQSMLSSISWGFGLMSSIFVLALLSVLVSFSLRFNRISRCYPESRTKGDPPQVPYSIPVVGHLISYLLDASQLASFIT